MSQDKIEKIYGKSCDESNLVFASIPFPLIIAWDKTKTTRRIRCHKLVKKDVENIFKDILATYGLEKIKELGINLFGGCYECRNKRGGTTSSLHSWAIAIDIFPEKNGLKTPFRNAQFSKPEYKPLLDIFYKYGWINLGVEKGYDAMHFEKRI